MPERTLAETGPLVKSRACDTTQKNRKLHSSRGNGKDVNCQLLAGLPDVFKNLLTHANLGGNGLLFVQ